MSRKLKNPPIVEVVAGIVFSEENKLTDTEMKKLKKEINFEKEEPINGVDVEMKLDKDEVQLLKKKQVKNGFKLAKENQTVFLQPNRLTLSQVGKYKSYETFIKNYSKIIKYLFTIRDGLKLKDIGLRYINKFDLAIKDFSEYKIQPVLGKTKDDYALGEFKSMFKISSTKYPLLAIINSTILAKNEQTKKLSVIFDIDIHKNREIEREIKSCSEILNHFMLMREFKNDIFFENIPNAEKMKEFE